MIKVFLAEDEVIVREGIRDNIDWKGHGYEFVGEAADGELALPLIRKLQPDILITDIKMPFVDGLELSRLVKREFPNMEIILLTGYEAFEYAKEGIKIGIAEYLTKPITGDDLIRELDTVSKRIVSKQEERALKERYLKEMEENNKKDKKELFNMLVSSDYSPNDLQNFGSNLGIDLSAMWYGIVLVWSKSEHHGIEEFSTSRVTLEDQMKEVEMSIGYIEFDRDLEGKALLFTADSKDELISKQERAIEGIERLFKGYSHIKYSGGIGVYVERLSKLHESYETAERALAHRYFSDINSFFMYDEVRALPAKSQDEQISIDEIDPKQFDRRKTMEFLKTGSRTEVKYFVDEFIRKVGEDNFNSMIFRQYMTMDMYFNVIYFLDEIKAEYGKDEIRKIDVEVTAAKESSEKYISDIVLKAIDIRESASGNRYSEIVGEAIGFIEENYDDEDLSLNMLASHVNVSPNHLSTIFSVQTGQTFIKYLTDYRIQKAKEMLRCTSLRSSEISDKVGYKDPHYFSYLFKKTVGMTPTRFRGGKDAEAEE